MSKPKFGNCTYRSKSDLSAAAVKMPSATYAIFRDAILAEKQVVCSYEQRHREVCPLVLGTNKDGEEAVLAWQFAGEVSKGKRA
jgi:predicted DNA-binding transcriptional regulator YafY